MAFDWVVKAVSQDRVTIEVTAAGIARQFTVTNIDTDQPLVARQQVITYCRAIAAGLRLEQQQAIRPTPAAALLAQINQINTNEPD